MPPPPADATRPGAAERTRRLAVGAGLSSVVLQSLGPIIVREGELPGATFAFHRLWVAAVVLTAVHLARGGRVTWQVLRVAAPGGVAFALNVACFFEAVTRTSVANATVIGALQPVVLMLLSNRLFAEPVRPHDVAWTTVAVAGVAVVVFGSSAARTGDAVGDVLAFVAMVLFAWYYIASRHARVTLGALEYQAALSIVATLTLLPVLLVLGRQLAVPHPVSWVWIATMVAVPGTGHLLTNFAQPHVRLAVLGLMTLYVPVGSTVMAWAFLGEHVVALQVAGMLMVVSALALVVTRDARRGMARRTGAARAWRGRRAAAAPGD